MSGPLGGTRDTLLAPGRAHLLCDGVRVLFTERAGGTSTGSFREFNLSDGVGDDPAAVTSNRNRLLHAIGPGPSQLAWMRQSPPKSVSLGSSSFTRQIKQLRDLLVAGERSGELEVEGESALSRARSMYELILTPESVIHHAGLEGAQNLARATVLNGAMVRH